MTQDGGVDSFISDGGDRGEAAEGGKGSSSAEGGCRMEGPAGEAVPHPQPGEVVSFTDFHKCRFGIPVSDFLYGFLHEHRV